MWRESRCAGGAGVGDRIQRYYDRRWKQDENRRSELVVIGQRGLDRSAIEIILLRLIRHASAGGPARHHFRRRRGDRPWPDAGRYRRAVGGRHRVGLPCRRATGWGWVSRAFGFASLLQLGHNLSVDLYVEKVVARAKLVVVQVLGGAGYWPYGIEQVAETCRRRGIALAILPGDDQPDPELARFSTLAGDAHRLAIRRPWRRRERGGYAATAAHLIGYEDASGGSRFR